MLTSVRLQPNNVLYFKEVYPSVSGQKDPAQVNTDMSDFYHSNSAPGFPLDIDFEFQQPLNNCPKLPSRGYGLLPRPCIFTSRSKDTIYQSGGALDKENCPSIFLTGTLPASTPAAYEVLAMYSSYILNRIKTKISQIAARRGCEYYYLSVWEYQQRGALHLHICLSSPCEDFLQENLLLWKIYWIKMLKKVEELSSVPLLSAPDGYQFSFDQIQAPAQKTISGVTSYLAKYLSKDSSKNIRSSVNSSRSGRSTFFSPGRWFSKSRNIKALIDRHSACFTEDSPIFGGKVISFLNDNSIPFDYKEITRPYTNKISYRLIIPSEFHQLILDYMNSLSTRSRNIFTPVSSLLVRGSFLLKQNFPDILESIRHLGLSLDGVFDYSSLCSKFSSVFRQRLCAFSLWRSGIVDASYDDVKFMVHEGDLLDLLTYPLVGAIK